MDEVFNVIFIQNPAAGWHWTAYIDPLTDHSWVILGTWVLAAAPVLFIVARCLKLVLLGHIFQSKVLVISDMAQWTKILMNLPFPKCL